MAEDKENSDGDKDAEVPLVFPASLRAQADKGTSHVRFKVLGPDDTGGSCHLFIPQGFSVPDSASYTSIELGMVGGAESAMKGEGVGAITMADVTAAAANAGAIVGQQLGSAGIGGSLGSISNLRKGLASNPYTETQYTGSGIRSFGFTFKLVAESSSEADTALAIEEFFRDNMYPEEQGAFTLKYPNRFKIEFYNGADKNKYMPLIKECYLLTLQTTYNSTTNAFHDKGQPVEIDIALTFQEVKALTRNDLHEEEEISEEKGADE
tara:strand:+ start:661 stop:1458 length:798 start_codon:yes stop_codon:yes gene_type:complete